MCAWYAPFVRQDWVLYWPAAHCAAWLSARLKVKHSMLEAARGAAFKMLRGGVFPHKCTWQKTRARNHLFSLNLWRCAPCNEHCGAFRLRARRLRKNSGPTSDIVSTSRRRSDANARGPKRAEQPARRRTAFRRARPGNDPSQTYYAYEVCVCVCVRAREEGGSQMCLKRTG